MKRIGSKILDLSQNISGRKYQKETILTDQVTLWTHYETEVEALEAKHF